MKYNPCDLPKPVASKILREMDTKSMLKMCQTDKKCNKLCKEDNAFIWRYKLKKEYPIDSTPPYGYTDKEWYIKLYNKAGTVYSGEEYVYTPLKGFDNEYWQDFISDSNINQHCFIDIYNVLYLNVLEDGFKFVESSKNIRKLLGYNENFIICLEDIGEVLFASPNDITRISIPFFKKKNVKKANIIGDGNNIKLLILADDEIYTFEIKNFKEGEWYYFEESVNISLSTWKPYEGIDIDTKNIKTYHISVYDPTEFAIVYNNGKMLYFDGGEIIENFNIIDAVCINGELLYLDRQGIVYFYKDDEVSSISENISKIYYEGLYIQCITNEGKLIMSEDAENFRTVLDGVIKASEEFALVHPKY